jgi:hypothetical protein
MSKQYRPSDGIEFDPKHKQANLSRSSTLVSSENDILDSTDAKLKGLEYTDFHSSFLHRYCPDYPLKQAQFEEIELSESQDFDDKATVAHISQFLVNGWICR